MNNEDWFKRYVEHTDKGFSELKKEINTLRKEVETNKEFRVKVLFFAGLVSMLMTFVTPIMVHFALMFLKKIT